MSRSAAMQVMARLVVTPNAHPFLRPYGSPVVEIDGVARAAGWGARCVFDLASGAHWVRIHFGQTLMGRFRGATETRIEVPSGETVELVYQAPFFLHTWQGGALDRVGPGGRSVALAKPPTSATTIGIALAVVMLVSMAGAFVSTCNRDSTTEGPAPVQGRCAPSRVA
jgi:hypothetical protein